MALRRSISLPELRTRNERSKAVAEARRRNGIDPDADEQTQQPKK